MISWLFALHGPPTKIKLIKAKLNILLGLSLIEIHHQHEIYSSSTYSFRMLLSSIRIDHGQLVLSVHPNLWCSALCIRICTWEMSSNEV